MDKQSIKRAITQYARRGQDTQPDIWPRVQAELQTAQSAQDSAQRSVEQQVAPRTPERNTRRIRLALAPGLAVLAVVLAAALFAGLQSPRAVSAAEILSRTQEASANPVFRSFHGIKVTRETVEGQSTTGRAEEWFLAPKNYCYNVVVTGLKVESSSARCASGTQETWYMSDWGLAMLRDSSTLPFDGTANLDNIASGRFAELYDRTVVGTEKIQGRTAWVLEIALKSPLPESAPDGYRTSIPRRKMWVDQEAFFVLKSMLWNSDNELISTSEYESFQINGRVSPEVFNYSQPQDALVADLHNTQNEAKRLQLWQSVAQQANFPVRMGPASLPDLDAGNPYLDTRTGVVTSAYYRYRSARSLFLGLVIAQGPAAALPVEGVGQEVERDGVRGRFYPADGEMGRDYSTLVVDQGGVRMVLRNYQYIGRAGAEWDLYEKLTAVPSK